MSDTSEVADNNDLISTTEAAKLLNKDPRTVLRYVEKGVLPVAHRITAYRGARLYHRSDVEALAEAEAS